MKALIFDMDGTMVDNMMIHHRAWQRKLEENGLTLSLEEVKEKIHGVNYEILVRLFGDRFSDEERIRISNEKEAEYRKIYANEVQLVDGLLDFLIKQKSLGTPMAVASAAPKENVDFILDSLELRPFFTVIQHAGNVTKGKPDPEIFLNTAKLLNRKPDECLVFEDSPTGALSASRAGCDVVVVTTTHKKQDFASISGIVDFIPNFVSTHSMFLEPADYI